MILRGSLPTGEPRLYPGSGETVRTPSHPSPRPRDLIPAFVVLLCVWVGGTMPRTDPCASTDGPQFRCWIEEHGGVIRR